MVRVLLKSPDARLGDNNELDIEEDMTVGEVKIVVSTLPCLEGLNIPPSALRLIYRGRALQDEDEIIRNVFQDADLTQPVTLHAVIANINHGPENQPQQADNGQRQPGDQQAHVEFKLTTFLAALFAAAVFTNFFRSDNTVIVCTSLSDGMRSC